MEQSHVLKPAASVVLEQVTQDYAACRFVGVESDEPRPAVGRAHGALGELAPNQVRLLAVGLLQGLPDLLLPCMVSGNGEGHELLQGHTLGTGQLIDHRFRVVDQSEMAHTVGPLTDPACARRCRILPGSRSYSVRLWHITARTCRSDGIEQVLSLERPAPHHVLGHRHVSKSYLFEDCVCTGNRNLDPFGRHASEIPGCKCGWKIKLGLEDRDMVAMLDQKHKPANPFADSRFLQQERRRAIIEKCDCRPCGRVGTYPAMME